MPVSDAQPRPASPSGEASAIWSGGLVRGLTKRWTARGTPGTGTLVERILMARGIMVGDEFLRASLRDVEPPWERPDYLAVADRLIAAVRRGGPIAIYGDYDVDGITATAILWHALRAIDQSLPIETYVPHRMDEGYGLNAAALAQLAGRGVRTVITVDCGVTAVEEAVEAERLGLELLITDHHRPRDDGSLPSVPIAHPDLPGRTHRFPAVCGAVVAWKLAWAVFDRIAGSPEGHRLPAAYRASLSALLPLAAIGTIADVMPLVGENRAIVRAGLASVADTGIAGLNALMKLNDVGPKGLDPERVGFRLAPRLNAAGRLGSAEAAVRLLTTAQGKECDEIVRALDEVNTERRRTEQGIFADASAMVRARGMDRDDCPAIVLASPDWHAGVVGIVCSKLVETFARPTILLQRMEDVCKGSGRSIGGFSLIEAIQGCGVAPLRSGGHAVAAGITLANDRLDAFTEAFTAFARSRLSAEDLIGRLHVDCPAEIAELDVASVLACERLAPFGRENPRPAVLLEQVTVTAPPRRMGSSDRHLLLHLRRQDHGPFLKVKWWNGAVHAEAVRVGTVLDAVIEPKVDRYLGTESVEGEIKDVRLGRIPGAKAEERGDPRDPGPTMTKRFR